MMLGGFLGALTVRYTMRVKLDAYRLRNAALLAALTTAAWVATAVLWFMWIVPQATVDYYLMDRFAAAMFYGCGRISEPRRLAAFLAPSEPGCLLSHLPLSILPLQRRLRESRFTTLDGATVDFMRSDVGKAFLVRAHEQVLADAPSWALQIGLMTTYMLYVVAVGVRTVLALQRAHGRARAAARG